MVTLRGRPTWSVTSGRRTTAAASRLRACAASTFNGWGATKQGPTKTFPLRGIKESPPYLHDGRLLTLEDAVIFFNLILELKLDLQEMKALVAFLRQL